MKITRSNILDNQPEAYIKGWKDYERMGLGQPIERPRVFKTQAERSWLAGFNDSRRSFEGQYTLKNA